MNHRTCTAIVCAYNEEKTLAGVLYALIDSPQIDKIVVVDDGSSDGTPGILRSFEGRDDVLPIRLSENKGKGYAMAEGISIARGELLLFVDGDLLNLTSHFIEQVLHPIHNGEADMVIGYPVRGEGWAWRINPLRPLSGERALFRTDILPLLDAIRESRFGVETLINLHYCKEGKRIRHVPLQGLIHPIKLEKTSPTDALGLYAQEASQIAETIVRNRALAMPAFGLDRAGIRGRCSRLGEQLGLKGDASLLRRSYLDIMPAQLEWLSRWRQKSIRQRQRKS